MNWVNWAQSGSARGGGKRPRTWAYRMRRLRRIALRRYLQARQSWIGRRARFFRPSRLYRFGRRNAQPLFALVALGAAIAISYYFIQAHDAFEGDPNSRILALGPMAIALSASLATLGWTLAGGASRRAAREKHTLDLLMEFRTSDHFAYHRANVYSHFDLWPAERRVDFYDIEILRKQQSNWNYFEFSRVSPTYPPLDSFQIIANFYEFVFASMDRGEVDRRILRETSRGLIVRFYKIVEIAILHDRHFNRKGAPNRPTYEYLEKHARKWLLKSDKFELLDPMEFLVLKREFEELIA